MEPPGDHSALVHCDGLWPGHVSYAEGYAWTNTTNMGPALH